MMTSAYDIPLLRTLPRIVCHLLTMLLLSAPGPATADEQAIPEYQVKTAYLYNFARFVTWPETALQEHPGFTFCVTGADPFGMHLDRLGGKTVHHKTLEVWHLSSLAMVDNCQLVFIGEGDNLPEILSLLREQPVLTVSDADDFIEQGGIIQFLLVQNRVRFRINLTAASTAGLGISSKLLSLAVSVTGEK
jgi:hypothetical protein